MAALYTAETPAQALLEFLPHFPDTCAPSGLVLVTINTPDNLNIEEIAKSDLKEGWDAKPPNVLTARIGREWLIKGETAALRVPSVMLPFGKAWNLVLNPLHPQCSEINVIEVVSISVDPRLKKTAA
jgi:RES domain-containing protein